MNWNICNFSSPKYCPFCLFIYFTGRKSISCSSWFAAMDHILLCWGLHMLRRLCLMTMAFIVLQWLLWHSSGCTSFICIPGKHASTANQSIHSVILSGFLSSSTSTSSVTPHAPSPPLRAQAIHQHEELRGMLKILFTVQYMEIHQGSMTWWHKMDSW